MKKETGAYEQESEKYLVVLTTTGSEFDTTAGNHQEKLQNFITYGKFMRTSQVATAVQLAIPDVPVEVESQSISIVLFSGMWYFTSQLCCEYKPAIMPDMRTKVPTLPSIS